jgi:hypothetical protein
MGAIEGGANAGRVANPTSWQVFARPALMGLKSGAAGWVASKGTEISVDLINEQFGDCECEE